MTDLAVLRGLVEVMAAERTMASPELFDDAVQEGLIAAWEASEARPDAPPAYVHAAARNGVTDTVRGRPLTGQAGRRGWQDAHDKAGPLVATGADGEEYLVSEPVDPTTDRALSRAELASEVRSAVQVLDPLDRDIVRLRFWEGLRAAEVGSRVGRPSGTVSRRWTEIIRPRLREELAALAPFVS